MESLDTATLIWAFCTNLYDDGDMLWGIGGMAFGREEQKCLGEKPVPLPLCPAHIPCKLQLCLL